MGLKLLALEDGIHATYLERLHQGDEKVLDFIYRDAFPSLVHFGLQHLNDEFAVTNIIHECFLKAWDYRATMESIPHVYRFIRMNMRWHFQKHYANNRYRFYRQTFLMERPEDEAGDIADITFEEEKEPDEKRLEQIYKVIPYLPMNRQTITQLYFEYGMGYKQIAKRFGTSNTAIVLEIKKCVAAIKNMVGVDTTAPKKATEIKQATIVTHDLPDDLHGEVYRLRKEEQRSFDEIAALIGCQRQDALRMYVEACQNIKKCA